MGDNMREIFLDIDGLASWRSDIDRWVDKKLPGDMWAYVLSCTGWVRNADCLTLINKHYFIERMRI